MDKFTYPTSLNIGGVDYKIRTNYRAVLDLFTALNDSECFGETEEETNIIHASMILQIMFYDFEIIPSEHIQEAINKVCEFIDMGIPDGGKSPKTMDWEQDAPILMPAINKVLGYEVRNPAVDTHWWTFLGAYMSIGESLFSNVISIRQKKAKGKKLEKWEQEYYKENKNLIDFKQKNIRSEEEKNEIKNYFYGFKKK